MEEVGMKKILGLVALTLVATAPVMAADNATIAYQLEIGGNNHAAQVKAGTAVPYTAGNPADGQTVTTSPVNWATRVTVTGEHGGAGLIAYGAANLVWDLELRDAANNLVAVGKGAPGTAGFYSSINDGTAGNPLAAAAFAFAFDLDPTVAGDPGRIFDPVSANGPHLAQKTYPSTNAFPAGAPSDGSLLGKLIGMGAGYQDFKASDGTERAGVGIGTVGGTIGSEGCYALATGPVAEGQIDMTGLPNGTYTLKLVAGNGNNILRGDSDYFCGGNATGNFAVKADAVVGDTISFIWSAPVTCTTVPVLASASSVMNHGGVDYGIPLALTGAASIEPRLGGPQKIVLTYSAAVSGTPVASVGTATLTTPTTVTVTGLGTAVDGSCVAVTVSGLKCAADNTTVVAAATVKVTALLADVDQSGGVDITDIGATKQQSLKPITASNFLRDVNVDGAIDILDIGQVKQKSLKVTPVTCSN